MTVACSETNTDEVLRQLFLAMATRTSTTRAGPTIGIARAAGVMPYIR